MGWFHFSLQDTCYAFLSVLLEGVPFLLLGTLISGLIDQFLPSRVMVRFLPRNAFLGASAAAALGLVFPMCECGVVPVIRRLIAKGLPVSNAVAYMLAAPILNPLVALSTFAAFRGQGALEFTVLRLGLGFFISVVAAMAVHNLPVRVVLQQRVLEDAAFSPDTGAVRALPLGKRFVAAMETSVRDFLDVMVFFVIGAALAATFSTSVNQEAILPLASNVWAAVASMMGLAILLSLCSTSDAFIAATFVAFPAVAKLAFLVLGPMLDLKLLMIYGSVFRRRFVAGLAIGLFVLIGLLCVRLSFLDL